MSKVTILALVTLAGAIPVAYGAPPRVSAARLEVTQLRPVTVRGERFKRAERVTLVLRAGRTWTRSVTAGETGVFTARFRVSLGRCAGYSVQAFGSKGSRARTLPQPRTGCEEPPEK